MCPGSPPKRAQDGGRAASAGKPTVTIVPQPCSCSSSAPCCDILLCLQQTRARSNAAKVYGVTDDRQSSGRGPAQAAGSGACWAACASLQEGSRHRGAPGAPWEGSGERPRKSPELPRAAPPTGSPLYPRLGHKQTCALLGVPTPRAPNLARRVQGTCRLPSESRACTRAPGPRSPDRVGPSLCRAGGRASGEHSYLLTQILGPVGPRGGQRAGGQGAVGRGAVGRGHCWAGGLLGGLELPRVGLAALCRQCQALLAWWLLPAPTPAAVLWKGEGAWPPEAVRGPGQPQSCGEQTGGAGKFRVRTHTGRPSGAPARRWPMGPCGAGAQG